MNAWLRPAVRRLLVAGFCWSTALYAWLASSPFAFQEIIRPRMFGAGAFSDWYFVAYAVWWALTLVEVVDAANTRDGRATRVMALVFAVASTAVGVTLWIRPVLPQLHDGVSSMVVGLVALLPILWLALLDHVRSRGLLPPHFLTSSRSHVPVDDSRLFIAAVGTAVFVTIVSAVLTPLAMSGSFEPDLLTAGLAGGLFWNLTDQLVIGCSVFLVLAVVERASHRLPSGIRYAVCLALFSGVMAVVVLRTMCDALGMTGASAALVAFTLGVSIVGTWGGLRLRHCAESCDGVSSPIDVFFGPPETSQRRVTHVAALAVLAVGLYMVGALSRIIDWDFLLLKCGVVAIWILTFDYWIHMAPRQLRIGGVVIGLVCLFALGAHVVARRQPALAPRHTLDRYVVYNPTFRTAESALGGEGRTERTFDRFLRENTGLADLGITPPDLSFVRDLHPSRTDPPPFVFLFVIDSLRHDYLAPYNDAVTFTPRLKEFAADSIVFRNAFTRYGGTGLSVPAMWAGGAGIHRQYIRPFWPTNTLEKLLDVNHYRRVMSVDVIMEQLLKPSDATTELDRGRRTMEYESCRTLGELESRLAASAGDPRPVFAYSLPQDLHVSNIITASVPEGAAYPGFHPPYASRVQRIDACFGRFIDFLKRRGWYDRSLIVVTADHGEMLGEEGLWGHVYYLFPPVIQVPLIVHLPVGRAHLLAVDPEAVSLTTDITPTIYAALGYVPRRETPLMGRSLIGPIDAVTSDTGRDYVLAASYSAVYAVLRANGRQLYIVDAVQHREYAYERRAGAPWRAAPVTASLREVGERVMREHIYEINRVYRAKARP